MNSEPPQLFARIYARHGHRCPMSTLGGRLGTAALAAAGPGTAGWQAVYGIRTCAVDGIAEVTGCSEDNGCLRVENQGRHALTLRMGGRRIELELTETALAMAGRYRALCDRLEKGWEHLDADERARRQAEMEAVLDELLPQLWCADEALLIARQG